ncbi:MAG: polyprenyl synthetase family protein [Nitrososphaerota archaeon]|nr:polyprenyl synthetase family protein [Nitrososphaerota archaeon]
MGFPEYIAAHKDGVYEKLLEYLPTAGPPEYDEMVASYVKRKGKYVRPAFVLLWAELFGANVIDAILPAAALQATEDWGRMHDDILDDNPVRRGLPAAHILYGIKMAINAGDALNVLSWRMATSASRLLGENRGKRYYAKFTDMVLETIRGQYLDMRLTQERDIVKFTLDDYYASIAAKSGYYSIYGPMQIGAIVAGANKIDVGLVDTYGAPIGKAFQIKDEILDCTATREQLEKEPYTDIREGTKTAILHYAVQNANGTELEKLKTIYMKPEKTEAEVLYVKDLFLSTGAITYAQELADKLTEEGLWWFDLASKYYPNKQLIETARNSLLYAAGRKK